MIYKRNPPKVNIIIKALSISSIIYIYNKYITVVYAASLSSIVGPQATLQSLIESMDLREIEEFLEQTNPSYTIGQRIALALIINLTIITLVVYGPTILNHSVDFFHNIPHVVTNTTHFLFETVRETALRRVHNATPETYEQWQNLARNIINNHRNPPAA
jgi:hypothetical protein